MCQSKEHCYICCIIDNSKGLWVRDQRAACLGGSSSLSLVARHWLGPQSPKGLTGLEELLPRWFSPKAGQVSTGCLGVGAQFLSIWAADVLSTGWLALPQKANWQAKTEASVLSDLVWELDIVSPAMILVTQVSPDSVKETTQISQ